MTWQPTFIYLVLIIEYMLAADGSLLKDNGLNHFGLYSSQAVSYVRVRILDFDDLKVIRLIGLLYSVPLVSYAVLISTINFKKSSCPLLTSQ